MARARSSYTRPSWKLLAECSSTHSAERYGAARQGLRERLDHEHDDSGDQTDSL